MIAFPNAKINLGLYITDKRSDGYHNIESIFYPIPFFDCLELCESKILELKNLGKKVNCKPEQNLIIKAWHLLESDFPKLVHPVTFTLIKNIYSGAGLGGGSTDGSFALLLLNNFFGLNLAKEQLKHYAAKLGSDCPFFIENSPCIAKGKGELLSPIDINLKGVYLLLIKPNIFISTAEAYSGVTPKPINFNLENVAKSPIENWKGKLHNQFEESIFSSYPEFNDIKNFLYQNGASYAAMSGSGSTIFGLFREKPDVKIPFKGAEFTCVRL
jgi:4-diphosphocytidyl-2-C-methyl-D-erythritol kinase